MNSPALINLVHFLSTQERLNHFLEKLDNVLRAVNESTNEKLLNSEFSSQELELLKSINPDFELAIKHSLEEIVKALRELPVMKITMAIQPSYSFEQILAQTLQNALNESFVIRFEEKPSIVGGIVIDYLGKETDLSLKTKIKSLIQK